MGCAILWIDRVGIAPSGCCFRELCGSDTRPRIATHTHDAVLMMHMDGCVHVAGVPG